MATIKINGYEVEATIDEIKQLIGKTNQAEKTQEQKPIKWSHNPNFKKEQKQNKKIEALFRKCFNCGKKITGKQKTWKKYGFCTKKCAIQKNQQTRKYERKDKAERSIKMKQINQDAKLLMQVRPEINYHQAKSIIFQKMRKVKNAL